MGLIPGSGRCPGGGHGNPLQYSCLESPMDRGAWWAMVHGVTKRWTWLKWLSRHASTNCGMPCFPVLHYLPEFAQTHFRLVTDAIQSSYPLLPPSHPVLSVSQHQDIFHWVGSSHQVVKVLELQLQHQSFQWIILRLLTWPLHEPDNHDGVITHLEPDILEREVKWALGSITMNKASGGDGIPVELFQILKDDAMKALHSVCQQIWKTEQWPQNWKRSVFIPISKEGNAKEGSNYHIIALISYANKVMLKILQARLQQYMNHELPDVPFQA